MDNPIRMDWGYLNYKNRDIRCKYPFKPEWLGYCWGYALYIDKGLTQEQIIKNLCSKKIGCKFWREDLK